MRFLAFSDEIDPIWTYFINLLSLLFVFYDINPLEADLKINKIFVLSLEKRSNNIPRPL